MDNTKALVVPSESVAIQHLADAQRSLSRAIEDDDVPAMLKVLKIAQAMQACLEKAGYSRRIQLDAAVLKLDAERQIGEVIRADRASAAPRIATKGRPGKGSTVPPLLQLADLGLTKDVSRRCQAEAAVPAAEYRRYVDGARAAIENNVDRGKLPNSAELRRLGTKAAKKTEAIKQKMERLKALEQEGMHVGSVWDVGERAAYAGDGDWKGNSPTQIVERCVLYLSEKEETVLDPMCGSGTTLDVCNLLGRACRAFDVAPSRKDIKRADARKLPLDDASIHLVFLHPPYWSLIRYAEAEGQLSRMSWEDFQGGMRDVFLEAMRVLKPGRHAAMLIGDLVRGGRFVPVARTLSNIAAEVGFEDCGVVVKLTSGSTSTVKKGRTTYAECAWTKNFRIEHDLVTFWRKPA